jgi:outer membrane protein insertion porin family
MPGVRASFLFFLLLVAFVAAGCREQGDIKISGLHFNGVDKVSKSALANVLQTKKGSRLPWGRKRYFDRRAFDADLRRIQAFYLDRGFPDARVASFDVKLNAAQDQVDITVNISEGEPINVADIQLAGFEPPMSERDVRSLTTSLPLASGAPLDRQLLVASRERATNALRDLGYPYAEVLVDEEDAGPRQKRVVMTATPGTLAHFGPVEVVGEKTVGEHIVRRQLTFDTGDLFTRKEMRETQRKLYGMELFEFVNVEGQEERAQQAPEVPVRITVAEGKHQKVTFGVGYGTEEQARARVRWDHANVFGGAQHTGVEAKWSSLDRGVRMEYREPFFLASHFSMNFDGQAWQAAEPVE